MNKISSILSLIVALQFMSISAYAKNVIFFHPDGNSLAHWSAYRVFTVGPDGQTSWDLLPYQATYRSHLANQLTATSNAGATIHAFGVKAEAEAFGQNPNAKLISASGFNGSLAAEALKAGKAVALVQSGHIAEPGTAAFIAQVPARKQYDEIAKQVVQSGVQVILAAGERYLLPKKAQGQFGPGEREDSLNLISWAQENGYKVVYTLNDLKAAADDVKTKKLLGIFAWDNTYNDKSEKKLKKEKLELYQSGAPTIAEMAEAALKIVSRHPQGFLAVVEEEGTDNFANKNNARGTLEAGTRALKAIEVFSEFIKKDQKTLLLVASDSDASGLSVVGVPEKLLGGTNKIPDTKEFKDVHGQFGPGTEVFYSAPNRDGKKFPFVVAFAGPYDFLGGVVVKAAGYKAELVRGDLDNTQLYPIMYEALFDEKINPAVKGKSK